MIVLLRRLNIVQASTWRRDRQSARAISISFEADLYSWPLRPNRQSDRRVTLSRWLNSPPRRYLRTDSWSRQFCYVRKVSVYETKRFTGVFSDGTGICEWYKR